VPIVSSTAASVSRRATSAGTRDDPPAGACADRFVTRAG
jgi:hypothetical protein